MVSLPPLAVSFSSPASTVIAAEGQARSARRSVSSSTVDGSRTYAKPSSSSANAVGAIRTQSPEPIHTAWSTSTLRLCAMTRSFRLGLVFERRVRILPLAALLDQLLRSHQLPRQADGDRADETVALAVPREELAL